ncbi:DUF3397 domain-containing protein [Peribacillus cavernae]|uniref:DUF3397 domain-containing protein n=1 Tax=Peribacillus cavernae TaxID=1674310 RepID=A0A433HPW1_9BACI|nr:DUF3397 domain-containing protein [Peribacillus cavernae]MDQ0217184.1 Ca2+/Na+ antiporter [Peribacillus cavernae]RUQ30345.1 DUF3397 domain-containing protein [Peribacillus cavernae]
MTTIFSSVFATFITIPLIAYIILFVSFKQITKNHRRAVHLSMDISTLLFILSVHYLIVAIWGHSVFWLLLMVMIALAVLVVIVHYKVKNEVDIHKVIKGFWRVNFAFFFCTHIILVLCGLVYRIATALI